MIQDSYPVELLGQARAALLAWYSAKGLKNPELEYKVNRVMRTQFPGTAEILAENRE